MTFRAFLLPAFLCVATVFSTASGSPPNILFIHMEDMGVQIPAYGDDTVATPNLDRLAAEGVVFERAHVVAATCASSRGAIFTGLYPHQNGIMGFIDHHGFRYREGIPTFVQALKKAGYQCGLTYKTGVDPSTAVPFDFKPRYTENWLTGERGKKAPVVDRKKKGYPPLVNNSIENFQYFLDELEEGTPFYFQAQTPDTHSSWVRPGFIRDGSAGWPYPAVDPDQIKRIPGFPADLPISTGLAGMMANYYTAIQRVDWYVGNLFNLLEERGLDGNTVVVFSADHGPSDIQRGKTSPYENGLRVPFIVRWPGVVEAGSRSDALVSFVDLCPTFLDIAGLAVPDYLPGYSLVPVLKGEPSPRRFLYSAYNAHTTGAALYWPNRTITDGRYKLIHNLNGDGATRRQKDGYVNTMFALEKALSDLPAEHPARLVADRSNAPPEFELYDLEADPDEIENLAGNSDHAAIEKKLRVQLAHWQRETVSDPFSDPEYLKGFNEAYATALEIYLEQNPPGTPDSRKYRLDWSAWIPAWDAEPYRGRKDSDLAVGKGVRTGAVPAKSDGRTLE